MWTRDDEDELRHLRGVEAEGKLTYPQKWRLRALLLKKKAASDSDGSDGAGAERVIQSDDSGAISQELPASTSVTGSVPAVPAQPARLPQTPSQRQQCPRCLDIDLFCDCENPNDQPQLRRPARRPLPNRGGGLEM